MIFSLYAIFSPKSIYDSTRRAFLADVARPTNTQFVNIKPGDDPNLSEVVAGDHVTFSVHVEGVRPQKVLLHYSVDDGKFFALRDFAPGADVRPLAGDAHKRPAEHGLLPDGGRRGIVALSSRRSCLRRRSHRSRSTSISRSIRTSPAEQTWRGATSRRSRGPTVTVHAKTNMPASLATLDIANDKAAPMEVAADDPTVLTGQFKVIKSGTYKINFRTTGNQLNPNPVIYDIIAIPDRPPTARFVQPDKPAIVGPGERRRSTW